MGDVVDLHGQPARLEDNHDFIADMARFADGLLSEAAIKKKYRFDDDVWTKLGDNDALVEKIEAEKLRRIRDGSTKRERAQVLVTQAPNVLGNIMNDPSASPRHRVDAIKTLDDFAAGGAEAAAAGTRFVIQINLGADHVEKYNKSIEVNANDVDPDIDATPQGVIAAFTAKKKDDDGGNII
jgi:hypothetical protein